MNQEMFDMKFKYSAYIPYDPTVNPTLTGYTTHPCMGGVQPFTYTDWRDEMLSWHKTCYIHAGLNPAQTVRITGPDLMKFLNKYCANGFKKFPVGKIKHGIMVNEEGLLMIDGILIRTAEDEVYTYWMAPYITYAAEKSGLDITCEDKTGDVFMYQLAGPRSLEIIEAVTGENFHDLDFLTHRETSINGMPVRILRIGMAGSLAYEIHGDTQNAIAVYNTVLKAGQEYGIRRLGRHAYWNTHTEGGFPQFIIHFPYAWEKDPEFMKYLDDTKNPQIAYLISRTLRTGSMGDDYEQRFCNPIELGWERTISLAHDFVGKEALEKIKNGRHRKMVTLVWNKDDILDVYGSEFEDGEAYDPMDGPEDYREDGKFEYRADQVLAGNKLVGMSTGRIITPYFKKMISLATMDEEYSEEGTEVEVLWGNVNTRQKRIRAVVSRFPYNNDGRNDNVDINSIPSGIKK